MDLLPRKRIDTGSRDERMADGPVTDGVGKGMEIALTTLVFLGIGLLIDATAGTEPWFTIGLVVACFVGQFVKIKVDYESRMRRLEAERAELARRRPR